MPKASLEELRGRISTGEYSVESGELARDMLSKFALIRRVRLLLMSEDENGADADAGADPRARARRRTRPAGTRPARTAPDGLRKNRPR